jgi:hypothetical protein
MSIELKFNQFSKDYGFNRKLFSWYGKILINLNVYDEWYKRIEINN